MTVARLILREILHRRLNTLLGVLSVAVAVASLAAALGALDAHDRRTDSILETKRHETAVRLAKLEDDFRKITKNLGFNILILPKDQNLSDLYAQDFASRYMPEEYAQRLAESSVVTVNHLLPSLTQRVEWPEFRRTVILMGVRGEIPILHRDEKKPILDAVPQGSIVLGYELHQSLGLKPGDAVKLLGRDFTVSRCYPQRGSKDDITAWIDLAAAQEILGRKGEINAILALECNCTADRLHLVREEIAKVLPDTQVIEKGSEATARAEARNRAAREAREALAADEDKRARLRAELESYGALVVPLVILACAVWVGLLALANVRERRAEVGILRALGGNSAQILALFLGKAAVIGLAGAAVGFPLGSALAAQYVDGSSPSAGAATAEAPVAVLDSALFGLVLVLAPIVAALASWLPALLAAREDPAEVLREA